MVIILYTAIGKFSLTMSFLANSLAVWETERQTVGVIVDNHKFTALVGLAFILRCT